MEKMVGKASPKKCWIFFKFHKTYLPQRGKNLIFFLSHFSAKCRYINTQHFLISIYWSTFILIWLRSEAEKSLSAVLLWGFVLVWCMFPAVSTCSDILLIPFSKHLVAFPLGIPWAKVHPAIAVCVPNALFSKSSWCNLKKRVNKIITRFQNRCAKSRLFVWKKVGAVPEASGLFLFWGW